MYGLISAVTILKFLIFEQGAPHFALGPTNYGAFPTHKICSLPMMMLIEMAQGKVMPLEEWKTRGKQERTLLLKRGVKELDKARISSISG